MATAVLACSLRRSVISTGANLRPFSNSGALLTSGSPSSLGLFDALRRRFVETTEPATGGSAPTTTTGDAAAERPADAPEIIHLDDDDRVVLFPKPDTVPDSFAVVVVSGRQYKVSVGDRIMVDHLVGTDIGDSIVLKKVLLVGSKYATAIGRPLVQSCRVVADVEEQTKTEKLIIFKKKRRKNYRRRNGFRSHVTVLRITDLTFAQSKEVAPTVMAYHEPQAVPDRLIEWDQEENRRRELARELGRKISKERKRRRRGYD